MGSLIIGMASVSTNTYAQDDMSSDGTHQGRDHIEVIGSMYRYQGDTYSEADIQFVLESFPPTAELLRQSKRQRTVGAIATALGGALLLSGTVTSFTRDCYLTEIEYNYICSSNAPVGVPIALVGLGIGLGAGVPLLLRGSDATERAVGMWNTGG